MLFGKYKSRGELKIMWRPSIVWYGYFLKSPRFFNLDYCSYFKDGLICVNFLCKYRKIPKISPGAYIFQRPFLRGLFLEELIFGGANKRREVCI